MTELDALRGRARALVDRHDQLLRELDHLEARLGDRRGAGGSGGSGGVHVGPTVEPLLEAELARLERAVAVARRRQLVRLMPLRGRRAYVVHVVRRLAARGAAVAPSPAPASGSSDVPTTAHAFEAQLGERLGRLVVLRTELARAEQDVLVPYRSVVKRAVLAVRFR